MRWCIIADSYEVIKKVNIMSTGTAPESVKGLSVDEMKLLSDFSNVVTSRQYNKQVKITKLNLSYDEVAGFTIDLVEEKVATTSPTPASTA